MSARTDGPVFTPIVRRDPVAEVMANLAADRFARGIQREQERAESVAVMRGILTSLAMFLGVLAVMGAGVLVPAVVGWLG